MSIARNSTLTTRKVTLTVAVQRLMDYGKDKGIRGWYVNIPVKIIEGLALQPGELVEISVKRLTPPPTQLPPTIVRYALSSRTPARFVKPSGPIFRRTFHGKNDIRKAAIVGNESEMALELIRSLAGLG